MPHESTWKEASQHVRGSYKVFKPSALRNQNLRASPTQARAGRKRVHTARAKMVVSNILTLGLANVYWLGRSKKRLTDKRLTDLLIKRVVQVAEDWARDYSFDKGELRRYLQYRLGLQEEVPQTRPDTSSDFAFKWQQVRAGHPEVFQEWGL